MSQMKITLPWIPYIPKSYRINMKAVDASMLLKSFTRPGWGGVVKIKDGKFVIHYLHGSKAGMLKVYGKIIDEGNQCVIRMVVGLHPVMFLPVAGLGLAFVLERQQHGAPHISFPNSYSGVFVSLFFVCMVALEARSLRKRFATALTELYGKRLIHR